MVGRMRIGRWRRAWQLLLPLRQEVAGLGGPRLLPVLPHAFARVCLPPCVTVPGVAHAPRGLNRVEPRCVGPKGLHKVLLVPVCGGEALGREPLEALR